MYYRSGERDEFISHCSLVDRARAYRHSSDGELRDVVYKANLYPSRAGYPEINLSPCYSNVGVLPMFVYSCCGDD